MKKNKSSFSEAKPYKTTGEKKKDEKSDPPHEVSRLK